MTFKTALIATLAIAAMTVLASCNAPKTESTGTQPANTASTTSPSSSSAVEATAETRSHDERSSPGDFLNEETKKCRSDVIAYRVAACPEDDPEPLSDVVRQAVERRLEELEEEAGFDINKQIAVASTILAIADDGEAGRDIALCRAVQGANTDSTRFYLSVEGSHERIDELMETTCPGNLELLPA